MTGFDEDRELDDFLARRSVLHRRLADRDHAEPSADLDRLVLDKARTAIDIHSGAQMYRAPRWALPMGLAATVVLALAIVVHFGRFQPNDQGYAKTASAEQVLSAPVTDMAAAAPAESQPPAPAPAPALAKQSAARETVTLTARRAKQEAVVAMPPAVEVASNEENAAGSAAAGASMADAATPSEPTLAANNAVRAMPIDSEARRAFVLPPAATAAEAQATASGDAIAPAPAPASEAKRSNPQTWLREIQQLRAAGKAAEADRELAAFRKAFPGEAAKLPANDRRPLQ